VQTLQPAQLAPEHTLFLVRTQTTTHQHHPGIRDQVHDPTDGHHRSGEHGRTGLEVDVSYHVEALAGALEQDPKSLRAYIKQNTKVDQSLQQANLALARADLELKRLHVNIEEQKKLIGNLETQSEEWQDRARQLSTTGLMALVTRWDGEDGEYLGADDCAAELRERLVS